MFVAQFVTSNVFISFFFFKLIIDGDSKEESVKGSHGQILLPGIKQEDTHGHKYKHTHGIH